MTAHVAFDNTHGRTHGRPPGNGLLVVPGSCQFAGRYSINRIDPTSWAHPCAKPRRLEAP
jgi:hypothetical protein